MTVLLSKTSLLSDYSTPESLLSVMQQQRQAVRGEGQRIFNSWRSLIQGPHIADAVEILDDVLTRMQTHQVKKTPQLRALRSWQPIIVDEG